MDSWALIISSALIVAGWFANSYLERKKKANEYRLEQIRDRLVNAFYLIQEQAKSDKSFSESEKMDGCDKLSEAIDSIQLFGSQKTIDATLSALRCIEDHGEYKVYDILNPLRDEIRKAYLLNEVDNPVLHLVFSDKKQF